MNNPPRKNPAGINTVAPSKDAEAKRLLDSGQDGRTRTVAAKPRLTSPSKVPWACASVHMSRRVSLETFKSKVAGTAQPVGCGDVIVREISVAGQPLQRAACDVPHCGVRILQQRRQKRRKPRGVGDLPCRCPTHVPGDQRALSGVALQRPEN